MRSPRRLLVLADAGSIHSRRFAMFMQRQGLAVDVISHRAGDIPGCKVHVPPGAPPTLDIGLWAALCQDAIRELRPDIVHAHYASVQGLWGAFTGFHPFALTLWGSDINSDPGLSPNFARMVQFALTRADLLTGDAGDLLAAATGLAGGIPMAEPRLVRFGVDPEQFRPGIDTAGLRVQLGIAEHSLVVYSPRQFKPPANIHRILEAAPEVLRRMPDTVFVLGTHDTPQDAYWRKLHAMPAELGIADAVRFVENVPHELMPQFYNLAAVTLSLRDVDAGAVSIMESLACGTPVLASPIPANRELLGDAGEFFADPHDVPVLADALCRILRDPALRAEAGVAGRTRMLDIADYRVNLGRIHELYKTIRRGPHHGPPDWAKADARLQALQAERGNTNADRIDEIMDLVLA